MTSRLRPEQRQLLKDELATELAGFLVDDYQQSLQEAIETLYTSETFERLQDDATGLYYQSPGYVYSFVWHSRSGVSPYRSGALSREPAR